MNSPTYGSQKNPLSEFCQHVVSRHGDDWPVNDEVLAEEFVPWVGLKSFVTRDGMTELCRAKGIVLSFASLPRDIRGANCSYQDHREIVISDVALAPFSEIHTLLHEFREILEHEFIELGRPTINLADIEVCAEHFATACRIKATEKELPVFIDMATNIEKKWARYFGYGLIAVFAAVYLFDCIFQSQMEDIAAEIDRQRYVRT